MTSLATHDSFAPPRVEMLIVGAGITGLYQLYRALEAGLSAVLLEAGDGVGGTWFWNRYPEARFDSESYTYAYLFSKELYDEWRWSEHFAGQPEIERYLNHVADRFDLRRHIRLGTRVTSAVFDEKSGSYTVQGSDGTSYQARYLVAATGVLSVPYYPAVLGREDFTGESYHTGLWPTTPVDFKGKRVAVIGTGSSGGQIIPAIADEVASLTVYQRSPNWCTPLNNRPITEEEQQELRANFEAIKQTLDTSLSGFLHQPYDRASTDDSVEDRQAFYEKLWNSPGFSKMTANYSDFFTNPDLRKEFSDFIAGKIRRIVEDPATADKLIPKSHIYAQKRPPYATGFYEAFNKPNVKLVSLKETPIQKVTAKGIETEDGFQEFDVIVWATGFDFARALQRMGIRGNNGVALEDAWKDGPHTFMGIQAAGFPNLFFPGGPHGAAANNPRYNGDQVDFTMELLAYMREHGQNVVEPSRAAEDEWSNMVSAMAAYSPFSPEHSYYFGSNIPGKPRTFLINPAGRGVLFDVMTKSRSSQFSTFTMSQSGHDGNDDKVAQRTGEYTL
ncbi:Predicted flavoprotein CzcO associated with the cation diffusion facilitator CzcD [Collimonas sp. OK607]|uniref:flavin-containing monooxygenase n=1 Tax=Collimonas sp. OK607 TaxID=1798194 RepID=UPI0008E85A97|nr:NAD(P)/FAD-dependent oxidoreductase [Collimonas sp. OK607]SFB01421.1 Predicted flavoprotein CzcO associated with the cation diffusion facilitator CzcD [Collimonas sp. OK607]